NGLSGRICSEAAGKGDPVDLGQRDAREDGVRQESASVDGGLEPVPRLDNSIEPARQGGGQRESRRGVWFSQKDEGSRRWHRRSRSSKVTRQESTGQPTSLPSHSCARGHRRLARNGRGDQNDAWRHRSTTATSWSSEGPLVRLRRSNAS